MLREPPDASKQAKVFGVLVSINSDGILQMRAPINRFKRKLNLALDTAIQGMEDKQLASFESEVLFPRGIQYLALYSCCCNADDVLRYLQHT